MGIGIAVLSDDDHPIDPDLYQSRDHPRLAFGCEERLHVPVGDGARDPGL
jgi:hypothetical protein